MALRLRLNHLACSQAEIDPQTPLPSSYLLSYKRTRNIVAAIEPSQYDVFKSPLSNFRQAVEAAGLANHIHYLSHGETYTFTVPA
jgi:hypothetical protein